MFIFLKRFRNFVYHRSMQTIPRKPYLYALSVLKDKNLIKVATGVNLPHAPVKLSDNMPHAAVKICAER